MKHLLFGLLIGSALIVLNCIPSLDLLHENKKNISFQRLEIYFDSSMEYGTVVVKDLKIAKRLNGQKAAAITNNLVLLGKRKEILRKYFAVASIKATAESIEKNNNRADCVIKFKNDTSSIKQICNDLFSHFLECTNRTSISKEQIITFLECEYELRFYFPENNKAVAVYFQNSDKMNRYSIVWQKNVGSYHITIEKITQLNNFETMINYL